MRRKRQDPSEPSLDLARQRPTGDADGRAALHFGFGHDEVGEAFDLQQIDLAIGEGAAGEFPGPRRPKPLDRCELVADRIDHRPPAVQLQLGAILAGFGLRARKPQHQRLVEQGTGGIPQSA